MIEQIRDKLKNQIGCNLFFRYHGSRNQLDEFSGSILEVYPNVFLVRSLDDERKRSFAYTDILIGHLEISDVKLCKLAEKD